jgi:hypothetical protein
MKKKLLLGALAFITLIGTASALEVAPVEDNISISPNTTTDVGFGFTNTTSNATINATDFSASASSIEAAPKFLDNSFGQAEVAEFQLNVGRIDEGDYTFNVTFSEYVEDNGTMTLNDTVISSINMEYTQSPSTIFDSSFKKGDTIIFDSFNLTAHNMSSSEVTFTHQGLESSQCMNNGTEYTLHDKDSFTLSNEEPINFSYTETLNDNNTVEENIGGCQNLTLNNDRYNITSFNTGQDSSNLTIESDKSQDVTVSTPELHKIRPVKGRMIRGEEFTIQTYNQEDGAFIGNAAFDLYIGNSSEEFESGRSSNKGFYTFTIPSDAKENYIRWGSSGGGINQNSGQIKLDRDYQTFVDEENISISGLPVNATVAETVQGQVDYSSENVPEDVYVQVSYNDNQLVAEVKADGSFDFAVPKDLSSNQTIEVQALRQKYSQFYSEKEEITVFGDSDGDSVVDNRDECVDEVGLPANDGCPRIQVDVELREWNSDGGLGDTVSKWSLKPNTEYQLRFVDSSGDVIDDFNGEAEIIDETESGQIFTPTIENGVMNVSFADIGGHTLSFDASEKYMGIDQNFYVGTQGSEGGGFPWMMVFFLIFLSGGGAVAYMIATNENNPWVRFVPDQFSEPEEEQLNAEKHDEEG